MKIKNINSKSQKKMIIMVATLSVLLVAVIILILEKTNTTSFFSKSNTQPESSQTEEAKTTSDAPSAQADFIDGGDREPTVANQESRGSSTISDTQGNISNDIDQSEPIRSQSGEISLFSPTSNSLLTSGQVIAGSSSLSTVNYRVVDDISGMITLGVLTVVDGKFSGTIEFNTNATNGQIDIYATRENGVEYSNIAVPVRFR